MKETFEIQNQPSSSSSKSPKKVNVNEYAKVYKERIRKDRNRD